jgi:hypothetical protein
MSSQTETPKILEALSQLDPANNDHWTNDGLPNTGVVQRIANNQTIKRTDIQNARPGFDRDAARGVEQSVAEDFGSGPVDPVAPPAMKAAPAPVPAPVAAKAPAPAPVAAQAPADESETVEITDAQLHEALDRRVKAAQAAIEEGRKLNTTAQDKISAGMAALDKAQKDFHKYFPPSTQAELIRDHLAASNAERAARVAERGNASQLDAARRGGNSRGWVTQGGARGPGGVRAYSRKEAYALGMVVPGSAASQNRPAPQPFRGGAVKA